jgi:ParB-like chromosome segregation protein Spo0J
MPTLTPEQFDALRADIAENGVVIPVVKDQYGRVIDGNHRAAIAAGLGIDYPVQTVEVADDDEAITLAVSLNCTRRHHPERFFDDDRDTG